MYTIDSLSYWATLSFIEPAVASQEPIIVTISATLDTVMLLNGDYFSPLYEPA